MGIVSFYVSYLVYSALESSPHAECNWFYGEQSSVSIIIGTIITAAAISYTGFSVSKNKVKMSDGASHGTHSDDTNTKKEREDDSENDDDERADTAQRED